MRLRGLLVASLGLSLGVAAFAAPNFKTLTDAPRNIDGQGYNQQRPIETKYANGDIIVAIPGDHWVLNSAGQMGADNEYYHEPTGARLGVWAGPSLEGKQPRAIVSEWVGNIKQITGGEWTAPQARTQAGWPIVEATGYDVYGNYFYRVIAFQKFGQTYAIAMRAPYEERWNRDLDEDITSIITDSHMSSAALNRMMHRKRPR